MRSDGDIEGLCAELAGALGPEAVLSGRRLAVLDPGAHPETLAAGCAVRPTTTEQVAAVLHACNRRRITVVPQGGRTGLSGAAVTAPGQVILMTDGLHGPVGIDAPARVAEVPAGATLEEVQIAAAEAGLSPGIDLAARGSARIGGMIATNAGGMEAFRHGTMRQRVLGLEAVLADGTVLHDMARVAKVNHGYDLKQIICGSEGSLAVVSRAILRLVPMVPAAHTVLVALDSAARAVDVLRALQVGNGVLLAEIMWRSYARPAAEHSGLGDLLAFCDAPIYAVFDLVDDAALEALAGEIEAGRIRDALIAQSGRERDAIWRLREDSFAAERGMAHRLWFDVSVPLGQLDAYVAGVRAGLDAVDPDLELFPLGHLADGNLHLTVARMAPWAPGVVERICRIVEDDVVAMGGAFSAEHGIGTEKRSAMRRNLSPGHLAAMKAVKDALDPNGILNPGKVLP